MLEGQSNLSKEQKSRRNQSRRQQDSISGIGNGQSTRLSARERSIFTAGGWGMVEIRKSHTLCPPPAPAVVNYISDSLVYSIDLNYMPQLKILRCFLFASRWLSDVCALKLCAPSEVKHWNPTPSNCMHPNFMFRFCSTFLEQQT